MQFSPQFTDTNHFCFQSKAQAQQTRDIISQLSPANHIVLQLLPLLLSVNHPQLPGYITGYQAGKIFNYQLTSNTNWLVANIFGVSDHQLLADTSIEGIYTIGSIGSLGQNNQSDWDVWLCSPNSFAEEKKQQTTQKCQLIERWAQQIGAELHLFLVTQDQFQHGNQSTLDKESSGSAQHWLLLDEFYRSAMTIAGKAIRWQQIKPLAPEIQMIDFGEIPSPPAQEYFGAMMWQLYKGIDAPEKSILKALLLESYFSDFPHTVLLSQQWQEYTKSDRITDHYLLLLERISDYLLAQDDSERLELVRECFYLKCQPNLSYLYQGSAVSYQQQQFLTLTKQWGFSAQKIVHLDRVSRWDPVAVHQQHQRLVTALLKSYLRLKIMAQRHGIDESLYPQEMAILSRKLYSAYHSNSTKISRLPHKALSSRVNNPLFLRRARLSDGKTQWLLLNQSPIFGQDYRIQQDPSLIKLLGWAAVNNYAATNTKVKLPVDISDWEPKMARGLSLITHYFGTPTRATKNALVQASQIDQVVILLNMRDDATVRFNGQALMMNWIKSNIFSIGSDKYSLVSSIDVVYRNSWHEYHSIAFTGDTAILELVSHLLSLINLASHSPHIVVKSLGQKQNSLLSDKVYFLLRECLTIRKQSTKKGTRVKSLVVAGNLYGLFFEPDQVNFQKINTALQLYQKLSSHPLTQLTRKKQQNSKVNRIITEYASRGHVQFFLEKLNNGIQVFVLDEQNNLSSYLQNEQDELALIKSIYRFYTFTKDQQNISQEKLAISFNLPQFSRLTRSNGFIHIEPFDRHNDERF